jgi:hypothetical protein
MQHKRPRRRGLSRLRHGDHAALQLPARALAGGLAKRLAHPLHGNAVDAIANHEQHVHVAAAWHPAPQSSRPVQVCRLEQPARHRHQPAGQRPRISKHAVWRACGGAHRRGILPARLSLRRTLPAPVSFVLALARCGGCTLIPAAALTSLWSALVVSVQATAEPGRLPGCGRSAALDRSATKSTKIITVPMATKPRDSANAPQSGVAVMNGYTRGTISTSSTMPAPAAPIQAPRHRHRGDSTLRT